MQVILQPAVFMWGDSCARCVPRPLGAQRPKPRIAPSAFRGLGAGIPGVEKGAQVVGAGAATAGAVGAAVAVAHGVTFAALAPTLAAALPIAGAIAIGVALLAHFIGGGCGAACVDAAKVEQIYEGAATNLYAVGRLGMIGARDAINAMQTLLQAGQQHEAQLTHQPQAKAGAANLTKVINAEMNAAASLPAAASVAVDLTKAHAVYVRGPGWYGDSVMAATQWTDAFLQALAQAHPAPAEPAAAARPAGATFGLPASLTSAGAQIEQTLGVSGINPLVMLALVVGAIYFLQ